MEQDLTQRAVIILSDDSTGCDEVHDYFATEADIIMVIVYVRITQRAVIILCDSSTGYDDMR